MLYEHMINTSCQVTCNYNSGSLQILHGTYYGFFGIFHVFPGLWPISHTSKYMSALEVRCKIHLEIHLFDTVYKMLQFLKCEMPEGFSYGGQNFHKQEPSRIAFYSM